MIANILKSHEISPLNRASEELHNSALSLYFYKSSQTAENPGALTVTF